MIRSAANIFCNVDNKYSFLFDEFCETQWRHPVKTRLYNTQSPEAYFILWNAVTSLGENKVI